jgi:hypothetical protein
MDFYYSQNPKGTLACSGLLSHIASGGVVPLNPVLIGGLPGFWFLFVYVRHLKYGIFLLSGIGTYLMLARPRARWADLEAGRTTAFSRMLLFWTKNDATLNRQRAMAIE